MIYLKQSTASQSVLLGPFIDDTDGKTAETGLTIANTDIRLSKNGGNMAAKTSGGGTHDEAGWYTITLDATDTNTVGRLQISAHVSGALPVWVECHVLEEAIYDALFGAGADAFDANARIKGVAGTKNTLDALNDIAATAVVSSGAITTSGGAVSTVTSVTNQVTADMTAISGDTTAADNLEAQYDGAGLTGDNYPATQSQVGSLAVGAGGISTIASSATITTGSETLTYTATEELDGTTHDVAPSAGTTDFYYEFSLPNDAVATEIVWEGYANSNGDSYAVYGYDWVSAGWKQIGTQTAANSTSVGEHVFLLTSAMTGTGANSGTVRFRFQSTTGTNVSTDRVLCEYTQLAAGIPNGSTITLAASTTNENLIGRSWTLALGGQDISGSYVYQAISISGTATVTNGSPFVFQESQVNAATLSAYGFLDHCALSNTITLTSTGGVSADALTLIGCSSAVAGSGSPHIDASGVTKTTSINVRHWSGGLEVTLTADCTMSIDVVSGGTITVNGTGGTLMVRGMVEGITDNSGAAVTITQNAAINRDWINAEADTALTDYDGPTRAEATSDKDEILTRLGTPAGADIAADIATVDTVVDALATTLTTVDGNVTTIDANVDILLELQQVVAGTVSDVSPAAGGFDSSLTAGDDFYNDALLVFTSGSLAGQSRPISDYANASGALTFTEPFSSSPANGDSFRIKIDHIHGTDQIATSVWAAATRTLTAATNITSDGSAITMSSSGVVGTVNLTNTTTTNTDMRGTDNAFLAASAPSNFSSMAITVGGAVTVGTNNDKTGYSISGTITTLDALDTAQDTQHSTTQAAVAALNDISTADVNAQVLDVVNVDTLVAGVTMAEAIRRIGTVTSGQVSGAGTGTETATPWDSGAETIVFTVDASGNRTGVVHN